MNHVPVFQSHDNKETNMFHHWLPLQFLLIRKTNLRNSQHLKITPFTHEKCGFIFIPLHWACTKTYMFPQLEAVKHLELRDRRV